MILYYTYKNYYIRFQTFVYFEPISNLKKKRFDKIKIKMNGFSAENARSISFSEEDADNCISDEYEDENETTEEFSDEIDISDLILDKNEEKTYAELESRTLNQFENTPFQYNYMQSIITYEEFCLPPYVNTQNYFRQSQNLNTILQF